MTEERSGSFSGTSFGMEKGDAREFEIESLIKETLEESRKLEDTAKKLKETVEYSALRATPMSVPKEAPKKVEERTAEKAGAVPAGYEATFKEYKVGQIVKGKVVRVDNAGVLVDIGYKAEGLIPLAEIADVPPRNLSEAITVGQEVEAFIEILENKEGYVLLSKRHADYENKWKTAFHAYKERTVLEAKVTGAVKGGLVVDFNGIRGFIPASQISKKAEDQLEQFVGQTIPIKILEIDRRQGKVVLSHKLAAGEQQRFESGKVLNELEVGQVRKGIVSSIKSFGAFVDLGGVEGMIHVSELSWKRVNHPSEVLKVGDETDVFVLGVDKTTRKIALGLKELQTDPWVDANNLYNVGQLVKGRVARIVKFGAFIELERGLEGLCHISELSEKQVIRPEEAVKVGDQVTVKILRIIPEEQKIGLSIREAHVETEKEKAKQDEIEKSKVTIEDVLKDKDHKK
jgi:small subunit ribosomal protein S1